MDSDKDFNQLIYPAVLIFSIFTGLLFHGGIQEWYIFFLFLVTSSFLLFCDSSTKSLNIFFCLAVSLAAAQLLPTPQSLHAIISPEVYRARTCIGIKGGYYPVTVDTWMSMVSWMRYFVVLGIVILSYQLFLKKSFRWIFLAMFIIAFIESFYAIFAYLSHSTEFLTYGERVGTDYASGTFVNRNHFGFFAGSFVPLGLYFIYREVRKIKSFSITDERTYRFALFVAMTAIILVSVILSKSRGAAVSLLAGLAFLVLSSYKQLGKLLLTYVILLFAITFLVMLLISDYGVIERVSNNIFKGRLNNIWPNSIRLVLDYPLLGSGAGTFQHTYEKYNDYTGTIARYRHPHNEYLSFLNDFGIPFGLTIILFLLIPMFFVMKRAWFSQSLFDKSICSICVMTLLNFMFDFNLTIPVNSVLIAIMFGYMFARYFKDNIRCKFNIYLKTAYTLFVVLITLFFLGSKLELSSFIDVVHGNTQQRLMHSPLDYTLLLTGYFEEGRIGNLKGAEKYIECAAKASPRNYDVNYNRALFSQKLYKVTGNGEYWKKFLVSVKRVAGDDCKTIKDLLGRLYGLEDEEFLRIVLIFDRCHEEIIDFICRFRDEGDLLLDYIIAKKEEIVKKGYLSMVGEVLDRYNKYDKLLYLFGQFLESGVSTEYYMYMYLGRAASGIKDFEYAEDILKKGIKRAPHYLLYLELADVYAEMDKQIQREEILLDALERYGNHPMIYLELARYYEDVGSYYESLEKYLSYIRLQRSWEALESIGVLLDKIDDEAYESVYIQKLLILFSDTTKVLSRLNRNNNIGK